MNVQLFSASRRPSKRTTSVTSGDHDENDDDDDADDDEGISKDPTKKKKKGLHIPFVVKILKLNGREWPWIVIGAINSVVYGAIQPLFALFYSEVYGLFAVPDLEEQKRSVRLYAGIIFLIGIVSGISQFLSSVGFTQSGVELTMRMRKLTFSAMLRQEISFFDYETNSVGALVTRLSSDAAALKVNNSPAEIYMK
jgi:ATP-binding cassette subfamily B (MDR/TAP) protein 1